MVNYTSEQLVTFKLRNIFYEKHCMYLLNTLPNIKGNNIVTSLAGKDNVGLPSVFFNKAVKKDGKAEE